jgi:hypothetical protein
VVLASNDGSSTTLNREAAEVRSDADLTKMLLGFWYAEVKVDDENWKIITQFVADGSWVSSGVRYEANGTRSQVLDRGTWSVENSELHYHITVGTREVDQSITVNNDILHISKDVGMIRDNRGFVNEILRCAPPSDAEIAKQLIGRWGGVETTNGVNLTYVTEFKADKTWVAKGSGTKPTGETFAYQNSGTWSVVNAVVMYPVTASNMGLTGQTLYNALNHIDSDLSSYVSSEQRLVVNVRVVD